MRKLIRGLLHGLFVAGVAASGNAVAQQVITLHGASMLNDEHQAFTRALVKFEQLVKQYYGKPINFVMHRTASSGWRRTISPT